MIYENIKRLCEERGITVHRAEVEAGLPNCTIPKWVKSSPTIENLKKVADYLGVGVDYLLEEHNEIADSQSEEIDNLKTIRDLLLEIKALKADVFGKEN